MEVIHQEGEQAARQRGGQHTHVIAAVPGGNRQIEQGHGDGHAGGQTVHTVGKVDGVDRTHHNEGGKDHIDHPGQGNLHIKEGDIQVRGQIADLPQPDGKEDGCRQLQQEFLGRSQSLICFVTQLLKIVNKADDTENQRKQKHNKVPAAAQFELFGSGD